MAIRTVRLDPETEKTLAEVQEATGLPISEALKRGLRALRDQIGRESARSPYDIYCELEPTSGGDAIAPSTDSRRAVRDAIRKKLRR